MRIDLLGDLGGAPAVLRAVAYAAAERGLPPPAALIGDWFGSGAVIAPTVDVAPAEASRVFDVMPGGSEDAVGGGWFGYLSYPDAAADGRGPRVPHAAGGWSDCVLRQDRDGRWWFESLTDAAIPDWVVDAVRAPVQPRPFRLAWGEADREAHRRGVLACLDAIAAGEVYQACVCTQFRGRLDAGAAPAATSSTASIDFFVDAVQRCSPARAAYVAGAWGAVASLSPELFLCRRGDHVASSPIKGTLPLSADPLELRNSVKDVAENIMIVDLVRNDLGRVADVGTVTVPELLSVRPAPGVWHLVSTVSARVDVGVPMSAVLDATFPPASVTGTPKTRARRLLTGWEPVRRGVYCGTVGLASPVAGCELNVAIRTVEFDASGNAVLGVGGGITADSDPDREWEECLHKAAPITGSRARAQDRVVELTP
ncbi:aminodeoxychorismate synthase, component I [Mycolicibacterium celeriflavum]|uniref:Aminodeoxychorismate synthase component I n=1 Tax=Mycolicibacterium celeriflavum TaxID=1249101 RepID=A0A1X0BRD8_MYCCF|nr:aminodeoxychorismate synthase component I [Mycolicibacterium celeriflavum]MCV7237389.1 aminodeoxychorismate synthase component I [Mycolicibacterium celeriflavum]OBG17493.1 aminodeoxychorismate synthase, component I [Mycolicibacterium celeriflavum]ORA46015.1 aminodeoxychorismate synthase, component I [Mycolicibacterium celeriflavum]BBY45975.1 aminodeoxychorismate synthase component I [Mycolicibacterium celeriflavum]